VGARAFIRNSNDYERIGDAYYCAKASRWLMNEALLLVLIAITNTQTV